MRTLVVVVALCFLPSSVQAQSLGAAPRPATATEARSGDHRSSLDLSPMSPLMNIYAIHYCRRVTPRSETILGPLYARIPYEDIGHTDAWGFIAGYRRYVWKSFHIDYQLMPMWDHFYEENEDKRYYGFDLWNEFRFGYTWDFQVKRTPAFIHFQWPLGFALYSDPDGKPESFKKHAEEHPVFYFPPMFFLGIRF